MRSLHLAALLALTAPAIAEDHGHHGSGHAQFHAGFYEHLRQPGTSLSCCNNNDCRPARYRVTSTGVEFLIAGRWIAPPAERVMEIDTPDNAGHWCGIDERTAKPHTFCAIIPKVGS